MNPITVLAAVRDAAAAYPQTTEDHPWGETAMKVRGKVFVFLFGDAEGFSASFKLPESHEVALSLPFASPTGYGLGRSGWVTLRLGPNDDAPVDLLLEWLDESYRAVAPKRVVAALGPQPPPAAVAALERLGA